MLVRRVVKTMVYWPDGRPAPGAEFSAMLDVSEEDTAAHAQVLRAKQTGLADASGLAQVTLWCNSRGLAGSAYTFATRLPGESQKTERTGSVPEGDTAIWLGDISVVARGPAKSDVQRAVDRAQAAAVAAAEEMDQAGVSAGAAHDAELAAGQHAQAALESEVAAGQHAQTAHESEVAGGQHAQAAGDSAGVAHDAQVLAGQHADAAHGAQLAAAGSAGVATGAADTASTKANDAANALAALRAVAAEFNRLYMGRRTSDPTINDDGSALILGAQYLNTVYEPDRLRIYTEAGWADADAAAQAETIHAAASAAAAAGYAQSALQAVVDAQSAGAYQAGIASAQAAMAQIQAALSAASAGAAAGSAASAGAIYGSAVAQQIAVANAQAAASLAAGYAISAASVVAQDLTGVTAAALHRSPSAIKSLCIYDTSQDSDGGDWVERCGNASWMAEALNGKWLGACASASAARAVSGATTGDYFQLTTDGVFYKLNSGSGTTEVFRGNTAKFPRLSAWVSEASRVVGYDLTQPGRPMWLVLPLKTGTGYWALGRLGVWEFGPLAIVEGVLMVGNKRNSAEALAMLDFAADTIVVATPLGFGDYGGVLSGIVNRMVTATTKVVAINPLLPNTGGTGIAAICAVIRQKAPMRGMTGLKRPTIALAATSLPSHGGCHVMLDDGSVVSASAATAFTSLSLSNGLLVAGRADGTLYYASNPGSPGASFTLSTSAGGSAPDFHNGNTTALIQAGKSTLVRCSGTVVQRLQFNRSSIGASLASTITSTVNTGIMAGDVRRCYLADSGAGSATGTVADRSYRGASATTIYGALNRTAVGAGNQLVGYSGFSAANYAQEAYSADLDMGTGDWSVGAWVNYSTSVASTIAERSAATGAYITLGTNASGKITATVYDGTTTRTVTTSSAYDSGAWLLAKATYRAGKLAIGVNGAEVAATYGAPLLALNNATAVLTLGNNLALTAPFPGSLCLIDWAGTVLSSEYSAVEYALEKPLFNAGAQCLLPGTGAVSDVSYDTLEDEIEVIQADYNSSWNGLVRVSASAPSAGSFAKAVHNTVYLEVRTTTNPGVDVTIPARNLRAECVRSVALAGSMWPERVVTGFTCTTVGDNTALTGVTGITLGPDHVGVPVSGAGIPAGATITGVAGTTAYISAAATASAAAVAVALGAVRVPAGYSVLSVSLAGAEKYEGTDWTRRDDGIRETVLWSSPPAAGAVGVMVMVPASD